MVRFFKKYHKWIGVIITLLLLLFSVSGIILNHRQLFSSWTVPHKLLPDAYQYRNWNFASVKKVEPLGQDSSLVYGNTGIWLTDSSFTKFTDFSQGFPKGIDNKKIAKKRKRDNCLPLHFLDCIATNKINRNGNLFPCPYITRRV